jgi:hypothetical protein
MRPLLRFMCRHQIASVFLVIFTILAALTIRNIAQAPDPRLTAVRQAGYPVTLSELNSYYPAVPDDQNAALIYKRAFDTELFTNKVAEDLTSNISLRRGERLPSEFRTELAEALTKHAAGYELLYSATNLTASRYPIDLRNGYMTLLPHLMRVRQTSMLLSLVALSHASAGESD